MLDELIRQFTDGKALLALNHRQVDGTLLSCFIERADSQNGPIRGPHFVSFGELENNYSVGIGFSAAEQQEVNHRLVSSWQRLSSAALIMPAPGQPPSSNSMIVTPEGRKGLPPEMAPAQTLLAWAGSARSTLAVVFTDIVGSVVLGRELGDAEMDAVRLAHFKRAAGLVENHAGREIKTIGDSVMAVFRSVGAALDFACALRLEPGSSHLKGRIRAGIHIGAVTVSDTDISGTEADTASRVTHAIPGAEIWLSDRAKHDIDTAGMHRDQIWQAHERVPLKGLGEQRLWVLSSAGTSSPEPQNEPTWWSLAEVVEWVKTRYPTATVRDIRDALESRCRSGSIAARGRRRAYDTDRASPIDFGDPNFVWFSEHDGQLQPWPEPVTMNDWTDLTFFARPTPVNGEQYRQAMERAIENAALPAELRSKSRHRLAWADVEFSRTDVIRALAQAG